MKVKDVLVWGVSAVAGLLFLAAGASKFIGSAWAGNFARWGLADHLYAVIGIVEIAAGAALLVPRARPAAAAVLAGVMCSAIGITLLHGEPRFARTAFVYLLLLAAVYWSSRGPRQ